MKSMGSWSIRRKIKKSELVRIMKSPYATILLPFVIQKILEFPFGNKPLYFAAKKKLPSITLPSSAPSPVLHNGNNGSSLEETIGKGTMC